MLRTFTACRSGNVAMLFALALLPVLGTVGVAVDYARAERVRTSLIAAIDATALALAHSSVNLSAGELQDIAEEVFTGNLAADGAVVDPTVTVMRDQDVLTVNASAQVRTSFLNVLQIDTVDVSGRSKVVWGGTDIEVVMALDNTGSMSGSKLAELKKAARELIDTLEETATRKGSVRIGLVPFATTVRVDPKDPAYRHADWIHFPDQEVEDEDRGRRGRDDDDDDGRRRPRTRAFDKDKWRGCIEDRDLPYDVDDTSYDPRRTKTLYPAVEDCPQDERNLARVAPLTDDFQALRTAVNGMTAQGNTNITIGIAWALSLLSDKPPFTEGSGETGEGKTQKYLIVLTDGENTRNRFSNRTSEIDARTKLACKAARAAGTIFTIRVIEGNASLLRTCASDESNYYNVENAAEMMPVFRSIANKIARLRIAS